MHSLYVAMILCKTTSLALWKAVIWKSEEGDNMPAMGTSFMHTQILCINFIPRNVPNIRIDRKEQDVQLLFTIRENVLKVLAI